MNPVFPRLQMILKFVSLFCFVVAKKYPVLQLYMLNALLHEKMDNIKLQVILLIAILSESVAQLDLMSLNEDGFYELDDMVFDQNQLNTINGMPSQYQSSSNSLNEGQDSGRSGNQYRWPNGVLPYKFGSEFNIQERKYIKHVLDKMSRQLSPCVTIRYIYTIFSQIVAAACVK